MIVTQTRSQRAFVGSLNPGDDIIQALVQICVDNSIFCAHFAGTGYIANPRLRNYNVSKKTFHPTEEHAGTFHAVSLNGNVSLQNRQTIVSVHTVGTLSVSGGPPNLLSGELMAGEVISVEFSLDTVDDIKLYRADDDRTGLTPWLHMDISDGPPPPSELPSELPLLQSAPGASNGAGPQANKVAKAPISPDEIEVKPGDWLDHPTLGTCEVLSSDEDNHVAIRLESGRRVELHLSLLTLTPKDVGHGEGTVYQVAIKRRR